MVRMMAMRTRLLALACGTVAISSVGSISTVDAVGTSFGGCGGAGGGGTVGIGAALACGLPPPAGPTPQDSGNGVLAASGGLPLGSSASPPRGCRSASSIPPAVSPTAITSPSSLRSPATRPPGSLRPPRSNRRCRSAPRPVRQRWSFRRRPWRRPRSRTPTLRRGAGHRGPAECVPAAADRSSNRRCLPEPVGSHHGAAEDPAVHARRTSTRR